MKLYLRIAIFASLGAAGLLTLIFMPIWQNPLWTACHTNAQCTLISSKTCGIVTAVNVNYAFAANMLDINDNCLSTPEYPPNTAAICEKNTCTVLVPKCISDADCSIVPNSPMYKLWTQNCWSIPWTDNACEAKIRNLIGKCSSGHCVTMMTYHP